MKQLVAKTDTNALQLGKLTLVLPALIISAGKPTAKRFVEFFTANIRNPNTRDAYGRDMRDFFGWCEEYGIGPLVDIEGVRILYLPPELLRRIACLLPQTLPTPRKFEHFVK